MSFLVTVALNVLSQNSLPAYILYHQGISASWETLVQKASEADVVFFGEFHNNPIHHWLQIELVRSLYEKNNGRIIIGAEMFEADNQLIMDEYLQGLIRERNFLDEMRLWSNYRTDYRPIVEFARENNIPVIATNVPRRYASMVHAHGFEALNNLLEQAKSYLPLLPIPLDTTLKTYAMMKDMTGMPGKGGSALNLIRAQALKDATMAWFILKHLKPGHIFIHLNGAFHTDYHEGIIWYLNHYARGKKYKILTISAEEADNITHHKPDHSRADFIIITPSQMTKTH